MPFHYKTGYERYKHYYQELNQAAEKPKNRVYSTTVFSFLVVSLFGWYAIRPTVQTILFLRRELKDDQIISLQMEDKISALVEAQAAYQDTQPKLGLVNQALPSYPEVLSVVSQLRALADNTQASLSAVQVPTVPLLGIDASQSASAAPAKSALSAGTLGDYPLTVTLNGSFGSIQSFINGLLSIRRALTIDAISILPSKENSAEKNSLQLTLKLKAYYRMQ
ncbi:type 4a pilus biogenesis protein PilO [Candidatus Gottesmanbacteria bacterium]|nr:type 4a pilus biogenesis protein PilO [Candidatus Gottesmanbacteria bacterium]